MATIIDFEPLEEKVDRQVPKGGSRVAQPTYTVSRATGVPTGVLWDIYQDWMGLPAWQRFLGGAGAGATVIGGRRLVEAAPGITRGALRFLLDLPPVVAKEVAKEVSKEVAKDVAKEVVKRPFTRRLLSGIALGGLAGLQPIVGLPLVAYRTFRTPLERGYGALRGVVGDLFRAPPAPKSEQVSPTKQMLRITYDELGMPVVRDRITGERVDIMGRGLKKTGAKLAGLLGMMTLPISALTQLALSPEELGAGDEFLPRGDFRRLSLEELSRMPEVYLGQVGLDVEPYGMDVPVYPVPAVLPGGIERDLMLRRLLLSELGGR